jgi:hypothetical protein
VAVRLKILATPDQDPGLFATGHLIRDEADDARQVEYCAINPLKHRSVAGVRD